jgi:hypothetical protein
MSDVKQAYEGIEQVHITAVVFINLFKQIKCFIAWINSKQWNKIRAVNKEKA